MKTTLILLITLLLTTGGCTKKERNLTDLITENGIIYYYQDPEFGSSFCYFVIETETDKIYALGYKSNLYKFAGSDNPIQSIRITYRVTDEKIERCHHKNGFLESPTSVIEIISIRKI